MTKEYLLKMYDYSGGLNTKSPITSLRYNEASDLQNINILPSNGFEKRRGNTTLNTTAMNSGKNIQGLGYYRQANGTEYLQAICGEKIFKTTGINGTMDDITGAVTVTDGKDNIWTHCQLKDLSIFVGGPTSPNSPIKWNGTGNAAVLGGTPPDGSFGITANNRLFIGSTSTNPSRIQWSTLGNPEDWSGTGSGSQDVGLNDGETLVGGATLGMDTMLLFKQNSIWTLSIRSAPFPLYGPVFRGVGAISKRAILNIDGIIYFITSEPRMKATDGTRIVDFPDTIDDVWDSLNKSRLSYIHGIHNRRLNQILWFVSSTNSTTHDLCLVWDLGKKCWLRNTTGHSMNASCFASDRTIYCGAYDGKIYKMDVAATYSDASNSGTAIDAFWRTGWMGMEDSFPTKWFNYVDLSFTIEPSGESTFMTGFDFAKDRNRQFFSMNGTSSKWNQVVWNRFTWGMKSDKNKLIFVNGNGKYIQSCIRNARNEAFSFNGYSGSVLFGGTTRMS